MEKIQLTEEQIDLLLNQDAIGVIGGAPVDEIKAYWKKEGFVKKDPTFKDWELNLLRQWYNRIKDTSDDFLMDYDEALFEKIDVLIGEGGWCERQNS